MRLAPKWQASWEWVRGFEPVQPETVRVGGGWVDVMRLGRGDPLVLVPGLAGGWKLLWPLVRLVSRLEHKSIALR